MATPLDNYKPQPSFQTWMDVNALCSHMSAVERRLITDGGEYGKELAKTIADLRYKLQIEFDVNVTEKD